MHLFSHLNRERKVMFQEKLFSFHLCMTNVSIKWLTKMDEMFLFVQMFILLYIFMPQEGFWPSKKLFERFTLTKYPFIFALWLHMCCYSIEFCFKLFWLQKEERLKTNSSNHLTILEISRDLPTKCTTMNWWGKLKSLESTMRNCQQ